MTSSTHDEAPARRTAPPTNLLAGPGIMLISAAIFGYFGFMTLFPEVDANTGQLIPLVVTLKWTLRVSAIAFFAAAAITMAKSLPGNLLYAVFGVFSAVALLVVGVWDLSSTFFSGVHPFLLFLFAAWNGYGSWTSLRALLAWRAAARRTQHMDDRFQPPDATFRDR